MDEKSRARQDSWEEDFEEEIPEVREVAAEAPVTEAASSDEKSQIEAVTQGEYESDFEDPQTEVVSPREEETKAEVKDTGEVMKRTDLDEPEPESENNKDANSADGAWKDDFEESLGDAADTVVLNSSGDVQEAGKARTKDEYESDDFEDAEDFHPQTAPRTVTNDEEVANVTGLQDSEDVKEGEASNITDASPGKSMSSSPKDTTAVFPPSSNDINSTTLVSEPEPGKCSLEKKESLEKDAEQSSSVRPHAAEVAKLQTSIEEEGAATAATGATEDAAEDRKALRQANFMLRAACFQACSVTPDKFKTESVLADENQSPSNKPEAVTVTSTKFEETHEATDEFKGSEDVKEGEASNITDASPGKSMSSSPKDTTAVFPPSSNDINSTTLVSEPEPGKCSLEKKESLEKDAEQSSSVRPHAAEVAKLQTSIEEEGAATAATRATEDAAEDRKALRQANFMLRAACFQACSVTPDKFKTESVLADENQSPSNKPEAVTVTSTKFEETREATDEFKGSEDVKEGEASNITDASPGKSMSSSPKDTTAVFPPSSNDINSTTLVSEPEPGKCSLEKKESLEKDAEQSSSVRPHAAEVAKLQTSIEEEGAATAATRATEDAAEDRKALRQANFMLRAACFQACSVTPDKFKTESVLADENQSPSNKPEAVKKETNGEVQEASKALCKLFLTRKLCMCGCDFCGAFLYVASCFMLLFGDFDALRMLPRAYCRSTPGVRKISTQIDGQRAKKHAFQWFEGSRKPPMRAGEYLKDLSNKCHDKSCNTV